MEMDKAEEEGKAKKRKHDTKKHRKQAEIGTEELKESDRENDLLLDGILECIEVAQFN
jgi:hypothetical protein